VGIFVETVVRASMDSLWAHTQDPEVHQRWDLRFSGIEYLPKSSPEEPQRFRYATRIGFGHAIAGVGESVAERDLAGGGRTSSLRFGSDDPLSLIREGSGYWKYAPTSDGIRFTTWYDYRTRHGPVGALVDRLAFRPLIGWATAWSFDRLRLWLEQGIPPAASARAATIHALARIGLALTFAYHGLVPKLLGRDAVEVDLLLNAGVPARHVDAVMIVVGFAEIAFAASLLILWHRRWPVLVSGTFAVATTIGLALTSPQYLGGAFNPVTLNLGVGCLAAIDLLALPHAPSAGRCRRHPGTSP
jgi:hypothetical protein